MTARAVIIDDEAPARSRLARLLRDSLPDRVELVGEAADGESGLALIDERSPDLARVGFAIERGADGLRDDPDHLRRARSRREIGERDAARAVRRPRGRDRRGEALRDARLAHAPGREDGDEARAEIREDIGAADEGRRALGDGDEGIRHLEEGRTTAEW
jgi:DNA-binding NarL/FixJ family response regulator